MCRDGAWWGVSAEYLMFFVLFAYHYFRGGGACRDSGEFFLMNFELLTFPCREMIKLSIHMTSFQNESISIQKMHLLV